MALYTVPNSNPVRTITGMSVSASANQVPLGGQVLISVIVSGTNFAPGFTWRLDGQLVRADFGNWAGFNQFGGLIINVSPPGPTRSTSASIKVTLGRNQSIVGKSFGFTFSTSPGGVTRSTGPITVIGATQPVTPNPTPDTCSELRPDINWSGKFVYFPIRIGSLLQYPSIDWLSNGQFSTSSNVNWDDREWESF